MDGYIIYNMPKKALIFGVTGQDGSYLAELLLKKNYIVHGVKRRSTSPNTERLDHILDSNNYDNKKIFIHYGDVTDPGSIYNLINKIKPNEIYNLAAQSHVKVSSEVPEYTANATALGSLRILEAIKTLNLRRKTKYYQASSSEMFGMSKSKPQNELTPFNPRSVYAVSKVFAHQITKLYRDAYGIFASSGIMFNHESPRRGVNFVTKKIVQGLVRIKYKKQKYLKLGNIYANRDWGHAADYVLAMWKILQHNKADDFVISTGKQISVKKFINITAKKLGINLFWKGKKLNEVGIDKKSNKIIIKIDRKYMRETDVEDLLGNYKKARKLLKWKPTINYNSLIDEMIEAEIEIEEKNKNFSFSY